LLEISGRSKPYMLFLCTVYTLICACITYVIYFFSSPTLLLLFLPLFSDGGWTQPSQMLGKLSTTEP
jgi:hypothetical protein